MDERDITEQAFKNGYEKGKQDAVKWIPVTERLPDNSDLVLACGSRGGVYVAYMQYPGCWCRTNSKHPECNPTHWMPLPAPPKGE